MLVDTKNENEPHKKKKIEKNKRKFISWKMNIVNTKCIPRCLFCIYILVNDISFPVFCCLKCPIKLSDNDKLYSKGRCLMPFVFLFFFFFLCYYIQSLLVSVFFLYFYFFFLFLKVLVSFFFLC